MTLVRIAAALAGTMLAATAAQAATLDNVKTAGFVKCGVSQGLPGFSNPDEKGEWSGLDVDVCRAVASAIFDDPTKVKYTALSAKDRFTALQSGEVDILSRNSTWTLSRDTSLGLDFVAVNYYDGQGFIVNKSLGVTSAFELKGASVCTETGTTTELNLADFFRTNKIEYKPVVYAKNDEAVQAFAEGRCDAYTTDQSGLYANRLKLADPSSAIVLPEIISKEPLGPVVRHGDNQWADIVRWSFYAMVGAEDYGVTTANVDEMKTSDNPEIKRLLGTEGELGAGLGLTNDWAYRIIKHVGNYGESFDRNVGDGSPLKIARGKNAQWNKGGLQYAPPFR